jgi:hypothetical protein
MKTKLFTNVFGIYYKIYYNGMRYVHVHGFLVGEGVIF